MTDWPNLSQADRDALDDLGLYLSLEDVLERAEDDPALLSVKELPDMDRTGGVVKAPPQGRGRPGGTTRPHISQADRDLIEDRLPDIEDHAEDPVLLHVDDQTATRRPGSVHERSGHPDGGVAS